MVKVVFGKTKMVSFEIKKEPYKRFPYLETCVRNGVNEFTALLRLASGEMVCSMCFHFFLRKTVEVLIRFRPCKSEYPACAFSNSVNLLFYVSSLFILSKQALSRQT